MGEKQRTLSALFQRLVEGRFPGIASRLRTAADGQGEIGVTTA